MPRGDGYLRRKGSILYWEFMHKGKRYTIRLGKITKSEARNIVADIKAKIIRGEWEKERERELSMGELIEAYRKWYESHSRARRRSKEVHLYRLKLLEKRFGNMKVHEVRWLEIENYKSKRLEEGVSKYTVNKELKILRSVFNKARALGLYGGEVPEIELFKEEGKERVRYLSPEEAKALVDACPEWFKPVVIFALNTGLRAGEIFSLTWDSVDFENRVIRVKNESTKTKEVYGLKILTKLELIKRD
jgi:integrase